MSTTGTRKPHRAIGQSGYLNFRRTLLTLGFLVLNCTRTGLANGQGGDSTAHVDSTLI